MKKKVTCIFAAIILISTVCLVSPSLAQGILTKDLDFGITSAQLLAEANTLFADGKYLEAITKYNRVISTGLKSIEAYVNRGDCNIALGRYSDAIKDYETALKFDNTNEGVKLKLDEAKQKKDTSAPALVKATIVAATLTKQPEKSSFQGSTSTSDLLVNANNLFLDGRYIEAITVYTRVIKAGLRSIEAYVNRGDSYSALGRYSEAVKDYEAALLIDGTDENIKLKRDDAKSKIGTTAAVKSTVIAATITKQSDKEAFTGSTAASSLLVNANNLFSDGKYIDAITAYTRVIKAGLRSAEAYINRGDCYSALGRYSEALKDYEAALLIDSTNENIKLKRDEAKSKSGGSSAPSATVVAVAQPTTEYKPVVISTTIVSQVPIVTSAPVAPTPIATQASTDSSSINLVSFKGDGFSIKVPEGWSTKDMSTDEKRSYSFTAGDGRKVLVYVSKSKIDANTIPCDTVLQSIKKETGSSFSLIFQKSATLDGNNACDILYQYTAEDGTSSMYMDRMYSAIINGYFASITLSTPILVGGTESSNVRSNTIPAGTQTEILNSFHYTGN